MSKVTVVIPTYKVKDTISKTLHSIAMQTFVDEIEVIIANDCDGLDYSEIISKFPELNIRFVVNDVNRGCGGARNLGIRNASTDYVMFVDGDDMLINPLSVEILYHTITSKNADMIRSGFISEMRKDDGVALKHMKEQCTWMHGCLIRRQFIIDNDLFFREKLRLSEDALFNQLIVDMGGKIYEIPIVTCLWRDNPNSLTHESLYKNKFTFIDVCKEYINECNNRGLLNDRVIVRILQNIVIIYFYLNIVCDEHEEKVDEFLNSCRDYWKLCAPYVANVDDGLITKVYFNIMKRFELIPTIGFMEFLDKVKN